MRPVLLFWQQTLFSATKCDEGKKTHKHVDKSFIFPEVKLKRKHKGQQEATPGSWVLNYHGKRINTHRNVQRCKFSKQRRRWCAFTGTHHLLCNLISSSFLSWISALISYSNTDAHPEGADQPSHCGWMRILFFCYFFLNLSLCDLKKKIL